MSTSLAFRWMAPAALLGLVAGCNSDVKAPTYTNATSCPRNVLVSKDPSCCTAAGDLISPAPSGCTDSEGDPSSTSAMISGFSSLTFAAASLDQADLLVSSNGKVDVSMLGNVGNPSFTGSGAGGGAPLFDPASNRSAAPNEAPRGTPATGGLSQSASLGTVTPPTSNGILASVAGALGIAQPKSTSTTRAETGTPGSTNSNSSALPVRSTEDSAAATTTAPKAFLPGISGIVYTEAAGGGHPRRSTGPAEAAAPQTFDGMGLVIRSPSAQGYVTMLGLDPEDYFSRIAPDDSIFKRVNLRYREKENEFLLAPLRKR